ncbi:serine/threonine-protein kinase [Hyalangium rubrum]|uniref:Serine/threonine-protein kinase n=1 Tax=Hyalangium rubrum TaxID=3103134 RepID=A0ABU5HGJ0_9BACT|nr:serine/threonine-protein kinase [Hyalangium sp. s54d21]MDY7231958.1 serine/threonine-protein kinase [Hyalangium sp. s54d21]
MDTPHAPELHPASIPTGTQLAYWRVVGWHGRGTHGTVYKAVSTLDAKAAPVAIKLAVTPEDPRFEREVSLLSALHHPHVPALHAHGLWRQGPRNYPYIVMQWVEGAPLYEWAAARRVSSRQAMRVLAQVARALEATHAARCIHRNVKGDNILVREDGHAFLMDFGAGQHVGAPRPAWEPLLPGTGVYRSPEAWSFWFEFVDEPSSQYPAEPEDDLFALGVIAYRLVTGQYPPSTDPTKSASYVWYAPSPGPRDPLALNFRVDPQLNALILRMLCVRPRDRGTARELATLLEQEAEHAGPRADLPLFEEVREAPPIAPSPWNWRPRHALASVLLLFALGALWAIHEPTEEEPEAPTVAAADSQVMDSRDGGTTELADEVLTAPVRKEELARVLPMITLDLPQKPLPGQRRPDGSGKCRRGKQEFAINGGCWIRAVDVQPPCTDDEYQWGDGCYYPAYNTPREPTSNPPKSHPPPP